MRNFDVVIVGAGIAGASLAYELAHTRSALLVDMESVAGYHSTGRSAALFSGNFASRSTYALAMDSLRFFKEPPVGFAEVPLISPRDILWVSTPQQTKSFEAFAKEVDERGYNVQVIDRKRVCDICPALKAEKISAGLLELDAFDMDVNAIHQGYLRAFRGSGGEVLLDSPLVTAEYVRGRWSIRIGSERVEAPIIVNAAGAWGDVVANNCGVNPLGLKAMRRTVATFDAAAQYRGSHWPFVYDIDEKFYFKLEHSTILASPSEETLQAPSDVVVDDMDVAVGIDRIQQIADLPVNRIRGSWAGLRVFSPDRDLVVGFDETAPGFFWLVGQGGVGIMTAPGAAKAAASRILGEPLQPTLSELGITPEMLGPGRFSKVINETL